MEFRYDPQARRLRMRALVPAGHHVEKFVAVDQFKFGVEEEYFLSDAKTFDVPAETPDALFETADFGVSGRIEREFLQAQIEVRPSRIAAWAMRGSSSCACGRTRPRPPPNMDSLCSLAARILWRIGGNRCRARRT